MQHYGLVGGMLKNIGEVGNIPLMQPKNQCNLCGTALTAGPAICSSCRFGDLDTEPLNQGHAVTIYLKKPERYKVQGIQSFKPVVELSRFIRQSKSGKHKQQMAEILTIGLKHSIDLNEFDLLTAPPSGSEGPNHMNEIGSLVSNRVDIPFDDSMYKKGEYPPQKSMETLQERIANVRDNIGWGNPKDGINKAVVLDDIATSIATVANTARALKSNGVSHVAMIAISRNEDCRSLKDAGILEEE